MAISFPTGDFVTSSLVGSIDASQDTATIGAGLTLPATNGVLVIDYDSTAAVGAASGPETITYATYTTGTGALAGITRGKAGTSGVTHANGASVQCSSSAVLYTEVEDRLTAVQAGAALALVDGWQDPAETWTYASGTTITVPAGNLTKRSVGDKIKLSQSIPLTAYFPLEDKDSDVGTFTVANVGTPTYTAGKFSNALTLDGSTDALAITDAAGFKPASSAPFTLGLWFKTSTTGAYQGVFQSHSINPTNRAGFRCYISSDNKMYYQTANNTGANTVSELNSGSTVTDGNWHYLLVTWQGNFGKMFLDGVLVSSGYMMAPVYGATNYIRIGCLCDAGSNASFFNGQIDDLFLINGFAVDAALVAAKYAEGTAQTNANITATQYFYVTTVADQLLTVTGGADYVLYNATISSPYYSKASSPVGFPDWLNTALGSTGITAASTTGTFKLDGQLATLIFFASGTGSTTAFTLTGLPISADAKTVVQYCTLGSAQDNGTYKTAACRGYILGSAPTTMVLNADMNAATWTASGARLAYGTMIYKIA